MFFPLFGAAVQLSDLAKELGVEISWDYWRDIGYLKKGENILQIKPDTNVLLRNYQHRINVDTIRRGKNNEILLEDKAVAAIRKEFYSFDISESDLQKVTTIILDAGHGGSDPGACSRFKVNGKILQEKDIALDVVLQVYAMLKKQYPAKRILLTRSGDTYPTLPERTALANKVEMGENDSVLFISVHVNSAINDKATGFEVWYLSPEVERDMVTDKMKENLQEAGVVHILNRLLDEETSVESVKLAKSILNEMAVKIDGRSPNRGIRDEEWYVVRHAKMPSVLIELGFLSNKEEANLLDTKEYRADLSVGVYNGIHQFIQQYELSNGFTIKKEYVNDK